MKVGRIVSSDSKTCVICGRKTSTYKVYVQTNISVQIPLCDTEERQCYGLVDVQEVVDKSIRSIKKAVKLS